jgi:Do/DeqQ family serine protease
MRGFFAVSALAAIMVSLALLVGPAAAQEVPGSRAEITLSYAPVVKRAAPAVVNVYAQRTVRQRGFMPFGDDPLFRHFFGEDGMFGAPRERVQNSLGSGVIVDDGGFIVTNNHVIEGGTDIRVVLADKREYEAEVLLTDERTDLAVLKVDAGGEALPTLPLGDSDALEVGDLVLAVGNPFGVGQTVTSGIVSALARTEVGVTDYQFFVQTDAAINPGNSGGALVDMAGRLVGINTAIFSRSGGSIGIGFAIPVNMVKAVIRSSATNGRVVRPWGGVEIQEVTPDIAQALGLDRPVGALVSDVHPMSPLNKAGVQRGDVIVSLNGKAIESSREFSYRLATAPVGETAQRRLAQGRRAQQRRCQADRAAGNPAARRDAGAGPQPVRRPRRRQPVAGGGGRTGPAEFVKLGRGGAGRARRPGPARRLPQGRRAGGGQRVALDEVSSLSDVVTRRGGGIWEIAVERGGRLMRMQLAG